MLQLAGVLVNDNILQNSSINHLVQRVLIKYKKACILLERARDSGGSKHHRGLPDLNWTRYEQEIKLSGIICFCSRVRPTLIIKTLLSYFFLSTNVRPNPDSTGLSHVPTLEPLPRRINIGKTNLLHYMLHGFSSTLVDKLLYNTVKFLDYLA